MDRRINQYICHFALAPKVKRTANMQSGDEFFFCHSIKRNDWFELRQNTCSARAHEHIQWERLALACYPLAETVSSMMEFTGDRIRQEFAILLQICYECDRPKSFRQTSIGYRDNEREIISREIPCDI